MSEGVKFRNLSFVARTQEMDGDNLSETLKNFKSVEIPSALENQIININEESIDDSVLLYTDHLPTSDESASISRGSANLIVFDIEDGAIEITGDIDPSLLDEFKSTLEDTLDIVETLHVVDYKIDFNIDKKFEDLDVQISGPNDYEYQGVRFSHDNFNYIVQSHFSHHLEEREIREDPSEVDEEDRETTRATVRLIEHIDVSETDEFTNGFIERSRAILEGL